VQHPNRTPYEEQWQRYRKTNRAFWFVWLGFLPFFVLVSGPVAQWSENVAGGLLFAWIFAFFVVGIRAGNFRCPRCGKRFFSTWWYHNGWSSKCLHCGLPKWSGSERKPLDGP
jgi:hypothetical protein